MMYIQYFSGTSVITIASSRKNITKYNFIREIYQMCVKNFIKIFYNILLEIGK